MSKDYLRGSIFFSYHVFWGPNPDCQAWGSKHLHMLSRLNSTSLSASSLSVRCLALLCTPHRKVLLHPTPKQLHKLTRSYTMNQNKTLVPQFDCLGYFVPTTENWQTQAPCIHTYSVQPEVNYAHLFNSICGEPYQFPVSIQAWLGASGCLCAR